MRPECPNHGLPFEVDDEGSLFCPECRYRYEDMMSLASTLLIFVAGWACGILPWVLFA
jgi:hypothetical protein